MEEDTEYLKLSVEDRVVHKLWKARLSGYEEVTKLFRRLDDEKAPEFSKYLGLVKKFVVDSNAVAQEKGLEATLAFVECYALAGKSVGEVIAGIVGKCIAAPKTKTKELAVQVTLMYIEAEKADIVQEELIKGMEHKNPKISAACVACMTLALKEFGSKVVAIKPLVKKISALLEDRDKNVRDEGKAMVIEMYRWVGNALKPQLTTLKPLQVTELEAEFEKVKNERAVPTRFLRSQQEKQAKMAAEVAGGDGDGGEEEADGADADEPAVDPYDLLDPVDILSQLPKDFYEKLEAKKWQERKEAVDCLEKLLLSPKLESGDYGDLVRALKKVISKDSNVVVVAVACKCMAALANGLKKRFSPYASACIPSLLEKFKEKKANVVTALREAVDAIYPSTNIEAIQEDVLAALESKNPQVKIETAAFLARCYTKCTPAMLNKKLLKGYVTVLLKLLVDPDPMVRDNAADALGTAMKVVGEKAIVPMWMDLDVAKQTKIRECSEKAVIVAKVPASRPATAPAKVAQPSKAGSATAKPVKRPQTSVAGPKKSAAPTAKKTAASAIASGKSKVATKQVEREMTPEEVDDLAAELFPPEMINGLMDTNWKTRLAAVEQFSQLATGIEAADQNGQLLLRILNKKPGIRDTNVQVLKARLEAVKMIAENNTLSSTAVDSCLTDVANALGDSKNSALAGEALTAFAEATKLDFIATDVLEYAFTQKSPKLQQEALNWIANAITDFGFCVQPKALMSNVKKAVGMSNPVVRNAAISLTGVLYLYMGQQLGQFFDGEKPATQQLIYAEFEKRVGEVAPTPTRGADDANTPSEVNVQDLMPHTDISQQITDDLLANLTNKDWKVRNETLVKVQALVTGKLITNNLGGLPAALALRMQDSNAQLARLAVDICTALAPALGAQGKQHLATLFPCFVQSLGDSKVYLHKATEACIEAWGQNCGWKEFFTGEIFADTFKSGSPQLRAELWSWLTKILDHCEEEGRTVPKDELLAVLPHLYVNLEDRNADVRKNSNEAVLPIMKVLNYGPMQKATEALKPSSRTQVLIALDKVRGELPAKPTVQVAKKTDGKPVAKPKSGVATKKVGATAAKPSSRRKEEDVDTSPLLQLNTTKNQRSIDEQKLKTIKWSFSTPREEFVELLRDQLTIANASKTLIGYMFHADFKQHLKAIDALNDDLNVNPAATVANLDLILKWMTLRFFDTNPSVLLKGLEYLNGVFAMLEEEQYSMFEMEATSFIPYLLLKIGDPKDAVRNGVRTLVRLIEQVYPHSKLFAFVMEGLKSKNARQRTECLDLLASLIEKYSLLVCQPTSLKEIARQIADRDNSVRNAALNCIVQAWYIEKDKVFKMLGQISDKDMSLLEERIKRADKVKKPPAQAPPAPRAAPAVRAPTPELEYEEEREESPPPPSSQQMRTAIVKPRHVSGPFGLDTDLLERLEGTTRPQAPQLATFDLEDLEAPLTLGLRTTPSFQTLSPPRPLKPFVPASSHSPVALTRLDGCTRPDQAFDHILSSVASTDVAVATSSMLQLDTLLQTDFAAMMVNKTDQLVLASTMQLRLLSQASIVTVRVEHLTKAYRNLLMMLITFFKNGTLADRVSKSSIHDLMDQLLWLLVSERFEELENGQSFTRVINLLIVKVIERTDHTHMTCALVKILHECVDNGNTSERYMELVMKCLWKIVKVLPDWKRSLEFNVVIHAIHQFLMAHPSSMWRKKTGGDMPLRTVKTILHAMVKIKGPQILGELDLIENTKDSELESYLNRLIKAVKQEESPTKKENKTQLQRLSKSTHELLSEIFRKIGSKDMTQEGLSDLYNFKTSHPEADIEPFLAKSSPFFQKYILDGMESIRKERQGARQPISIDFAAPPGRGEGGSDEELEEKDATYYLARLRNLQHQAGMQETDGAVINPAEDVARYDNNINRNNLLNDDKQEPSSIISSTTTNSVNHLDALRQRLDRVKQASNRDKQS